MRPRKAFMAIPFLDLTPQYRRIQKQVEPRILNILSSGQYIMGPEVETCEKALSEYTQAKHALAVSNGTVALMMALLAVDVGPGDEVMVPSFSFFATAEVVSLLGAKPIFVDIEPDTFNIDVSLIEEKITNKTKAIMPVSLFGQVADLDEVIGIAKKHNLYVIEDAAQSFGAKYKQKRSCAVADIGCTSFFPAKPLGCAGDGGAVFTNNDTLAKKMEYIRNHGQTKRYHHEYIGVNGRLDPIQCVVIDEKLKFYNEDIARRQKIATKYSEAFSGLKNVQIPVIRNDRDSVYAQYTLKVKNRDEIMTFLNGKGIPTAMHYPMGMHQQPAYQHMSVSLPVTEEVASQVLSLPLYPDMPEGDVEQVIAAVREGLG